uniref:Fucoxanthin-chlorophyll a/c light-harvesting protein n=1 Tax=Helicotheca tamesis TaxID=374047 RepID=A0A6U0F5K0_9STRA
MKLAILSALIASAAAFAPASQKATSTKLNAFEGELGAQEPLGFYDPLGLLNDADQERFDRLRYVELKHGRIAQLAFLGQIVTRAGIHLPGNIDFSGDSFDSYPDGAAALFGPDAIPQAGLLQIVAFVGFLELFVMKDSANGAEPGDFPGDFRNGALDFGWDTFDEETKLSKRAIELNNGRAAQLGILGLMVHEKLNEIDMVADLPIIGALQ